MKKTINAQRKEETYCMEQLPPRSPDEEPQGPEHERLWPGEIDLTGVVPQDDALVDVIGDAIVEAEGDAGELPEWGARTMARALANERDTPLEGALHRYAITGRAEPEAIAQELAELYENTADEEVREWINWLGIYVIRMPDQPTVPQAMSDDAPDFGHSAEEFTTTVRKAFADADARGEPIAAKDARAVATLLAIFLDDGSAMASFADTGDANPVLLHQECQDARRRTEHVPGLDVWIDHLEQHLASRSDLGRHPNSATHQAPPTPDITPSDRTPVPEEVPVFGTPLEQFTAYIRIRTAEADARGEPIAADDAAAIATVLAELLGADSAMSRYAISGEVDLAALQAECQQVLNQYPATPDMALWTQRFQRYLAQQPSRSPGTDGRPQDEHQATDAVAAEHPPANSQIAQGRLGYGAAFEAFLALADIDHGRQDLLETFTETYVGVYDSMDAAVTDLTEGFFDEAVADIYGTDGVTPEDMVRAAWDVVELHGRFYVFNK